QRRAGRRAALTPVRTPILVTGAAGFAGSHLLDRLLRDGCDLVAWRRPGDDRPAVGRRAALPPELASHIHVRWESVDVLNAAAVREAVARLQPRVVFHCAGAAHVGRSWNSTESTLAINVCGRHHL